MKKHDYLLVLSLLLMPVMVYADEFNSLPLEFALVMEAFVSIHSSFALLKPLAEIISPDNSKKTFWILFGIRVAILLFFDFFVGTGICIVDFMSVFFGAFIILPISRAVSEKRGTTNVNIPLPTGNPVVTQDVTEIHCGKCGGILQVTDKFCQNCGAPFDDSAKVVAVKAKTPVYVEAKSFDPVFNNSENVVVEEFIKKELAKAGIDEKTKLIPEDVLMRKNILNVIFGVLVYVYISLIFFHFPMYTYVLGFIILIVFLLLTRNFKLLSYLSKEIKSRPSEKISNIVMSMKNSLVKDTSRMIKLIIVLVAIGASLFTFKDPVILYEKMDGGYSVRYYAFGLSNYKTVTIPDSHKGEPVISIRGNGFSNMFLLEEAILPDSIKEIRGQAFLNDAKLTKVKLPSNLEILGGGAFANCSSLESIELPDTLTELGGESFINAVSLKSIVLPPKLTEIRGDTFSNCTSLTSVFIPDSVTRIGGHAFEGCSSLKTVSISENSQLAEIGSSAFRDCDSLYTISIPETTSVNSRAFKGSPTEIEYYSEEVRNVIDSMVKEDPFKFANGSYTPTYKDQIIVFRDPGEIQTIELRSGKVIYLVLDKAFFSTRSYSFSTTDGVKFTLNWGGTEEYEVDDNVIVHYMSSNWDESHELASCKIAIEER